MRGTCTCACMQTLKMRWPSSIMPSVTAPVAEEKEPMNSA